jgi:hypothetical protein
MSRRHLLLYRNFLGAAHGFALRAIRLPGNARVLGSPHWFKSTQESCGIRVFSTGFREVVEA